MAYYDPQKPYDLTILYMEDAREWCEYLFDLFQPYDVHQNSEDITVFPTQDATLDAIKTSQVRIIIISPTFIERCTNDLERCVTGKSVVGLLCGVKRQELHSLELRVPSHKQWELIEAQSDAKDLTQVTMKMLQDAMKEFDNEGIESDNDGNSVYEPMQGNVKRQDEEDLYVQGTQEDLYVQGDQEDLYVQGTQSIPDIYSYDDPQAVTVFPDRIHVQNQKNFYVFFSNEALEVGSTYKIKVTGEFNCTNTEGTAKNPYVLCVNTPKDIASGNIEMEITSSQGQTLATCSATLVTAMDVVAENLKNSLEPMNFICESLGISPASSNDLDNLLFDHIRKFQESSMLKNALTSSQEGRKKKSDKLYPTAIHFAAKFGLKTVTNYLLGLPGADHALKVKNRDNHTPSDLAKRNGHEDLSDMMSYPTESPTSVKTSQGYVKMMTAIPPGYQRPKPADKDELHRMLDSGNIYDVFYPKNMTRIDDEDHSKNYDLVESDAPIDGPSLPNPITPALPPHVTQQTGLPDSQKELWDIDQRMKNGEITQQEAHKEFEKWRLRYMAQSSNTSAPLPPQKPVPVVNEKPKKGPFGLRTRQAPGTSQDVSSVQPPPTRRQPDPAPVRQRTPTSGTNVDITTRRRSSGRNRLSYTDMSDYQPPSRDPPPIPTSAQQRPPRPRRPIPAPRP